MVKCGVLFQVRTKSLNIIRTSFGCLQSESYKTHKYKRNITEC
jgi:hypothetical protein